MSRRLWFGLAALGIAGVLLALPARPASAHPLGNFSVNQSLALGLYPDRVSVGAVVDLAELPTLQERAAVDAEGGARYNARVCDELAHDVALRVDGHRLMWTVRPTGFEYRPGSAGLQTTRITCTLRADADLSAPSTVDISNGYRADRIGWRELTATGHGVHPVDPSIPTRSVTDGLRSYPADLLGSPLDQRSAELRVEPGDGPAVVGPAPGAKRGDPLSRWIAGADKVLERLVGGRLTPLVGLLAVVLALVLGAGHAALPGHGKTVMAAYLAGRRGRPRDALVVGATVTFTHTGGVLVLGLLLTSAAGLAGEVVLSWLGIASGVLVATVGAAMLAGSLRRHARGQPPPPCVRTSPPRPRPRPRPRRSRSRSPPSASDRRGPAARPPRYGCRRRAGAEPVRTRGAPGRDRAGAHRVRRTARGRVRRRDGGHAHGRGPAADPAPRALDGAAP